MGLFDLEEVDTRTPKSFPHVPTPLEYWDVVAAARELPQRRRDLLLGKHDDFKSDGGVRYDRSLIDQIDWVSITIQVWNCWIRR
jgi:hypothetical protein